MKYLDEVRVVVDKPEYAKEGIFKGETGTIILAESRENTFMVVFEKLRDKDNDEVMHPIFVGDLELVKANEGITDQDVFNALPSPDPHWWCKVEDGYIKNLLGEKKNKIPYDYES